MLFPQPKMKGQVMKGQKLQAKYDELLKIWLSVRKLKTTQPRVDRCDMKANAIHLQLQT